MHWQSADPMPEERSTRSAFTFRGLLRLAGLIAAAFLVTLHFIVDGDPREFARNHGSRQRLSIATGGTGGVWYPYGGGIANVISGHVPNVEATAEVTSASIDNLRFVQQGTADIAFTLADALADAAAGSGPFRSTGKVPALALASLYDSYLHVATLEGKGVDELADLRGRAVSTGSPGSGTEAAAFRVLRAAGLDPGRDIRRQGLGVAQSVDALKDGKLDAFFWVGGVPTGAILDLANAHGRRLKLLSTDRILPALQREFGESLYFAVEIPAGSYPGIDAGVPVIGIRNLLVVDESMNERLAWEILTAVFDQRDSLVAIHPEARNLRLDTATKGSPVGFHPGAIRYYRERGVWPR
ncbi:MAG TPA: TAXI family TRAP transporter solute-binding subunit [Thermoanaerobaculia bacterium]|nr:TAXI family TRAP transporter solute-binding subunit [Thermoanaerobaculia bacterium]